MSAVLTTAALVLGYVAALVVGHVYIWRRATRFAEKGSLRRRLIGGLVIALACILAASTQLRFAPRGPAAWAFGAVAATWLGVLFYLVPLQLLSDALRRLLARATAAGSLALAQAPRGASRTTRRTFLVGAGGTAATLAAGGVSTAGLLASHHLSLPEIEVRLSRLPAALDGFRIALISDIHVGPLIGRSFLRDIVELTSRLKPDLIALCGDVGDFPVAAVASEVGELSRLRARHGIYYVTGNHEYMWGADEWVSLMQRCGARVLMNERVTIGDAGPGGARFELAGVPDFDAHPGRTPVMDVGAALRGYDPASELVMLAHQPRQVAEVAKYDVGLQLSGHTHGGQLFPAHAAQLLFQPYLSGLHRHTSTTQVFVSSGVGFWGPPMRVLAPAQIPQIILTT